MQYYIDFWKNGVNFSGKWDPKRFWMTVLVNTNVNVVLGIMLGIICMLCPPLAILGSVYSLAYLISSLSMIVRRLRDGGFTPWLILLVLIPLLGWLALLDMCAMPSK